MGITSVQQLNLRGIQILTLRGETLGRRDIQFYPTREEPLQDLLHPLTTYPYPSTLVIDFSIAIVDIDAETLVHVPVIAYLTCVEGFLANVSIPIDTMFDGL